MPNLDDGSDAVTGDRLDYDVFNKLKNNWRAAAAPADPQPGMIRSDSDADKLFHEGAAGEEEILQAVRSADVSPKFSGLSLKIVSIDDTDSPYSILASDYTIRADATSGVVTANLPAATGSGRIIRIKKIDNSANAVTLAAAGGETVDGAASASLTDQYSTLSVQDAAAGVWDIVPVAGSGGTPAVADLSLMDKRWFKIVMNNATYLVAGIALTSSGGLANADDDNSNFTRWGTGSSSGNGAGLYSTTNNFTRGHQNYTFYCKFKTYSDITNMRFFLGLIANNVDWNADPGSGNLVMLRYVSGTANFTYITKDGATLRSQDSGVAVAANTVYVLKIVVSGDGTTATFTLNGAASHAATLNLPAAAAPLGFTFWEVTQENVSKYLSLSQVYCQGD